MLFLTVLLALTLSFDCLGAGFSYGIRQIRLPWYGVLIICGCSGLMLALSMWLGSWLGQFIAPQLVQVLGAMILIDMGVYMLGKSIQELVQQQEADEALFQWTIAPLGIVIQILKEPHRADLDRSGMISSKEAFWLGLALSLDSCGAGIGMALMGYSPVMTSICTALCACLFLSLGLFGGARIGANISYKKIKVLPGCLLILIGIFRLFL